MRSEIRVSDDGEYEDFYCLEFDAVLSSNMTDVSEDPTASVISTFI